MFSCSMLRFCLLSSVNVDSDFFGYRVRAYQRVGQFIFRFFEWQNTNVHTVRNSRETTHVNGGVLTCTWSFEQPVGETARGTTVSEHHVLSRYSRGSQKKKKESEKRRGSRTTCQRPSSQGRIKNEGSWWYFVFCSCGTRLARCTTPLLERFRL